MTTAKGFKIVADNAIEYRIIQRCLKEKTSLFNKVNEYSYKKYLQGNYVFRFDGTHTKLVGFSSIS